MRFRLRKFWWGSIFLNIQLRKAVYTASNIERNRSKGHPNSHQSTMQSNTMMGDIFMSDEEKKVKAQAWSAPANKTYDAVNTGYENQIAAINGKILDEVKKLNGTEANDAPIMTNVDNLRKRSEQIQKLLDANLIKMEKAEATHLSKHGTAEQKKAAKAELADITAGEKRSTRDGSFGMGATLLYGGATMLVYGGMMANPAMIVLGLALMIAGGLLFKKSHSLDKEVDHHQARALSP